MMAGDDGCDRARGWGREKKKMDDDDVTEAWASVGETKGIEGGQSGVRCGGAGRSAENERT